MRLQQYVFKTRLCRVRKYAANAFVQPGANFPEHDVVKRYIMRGFDVPVFIQCSRTILYPPAPGWIGFLGSNFIGRFRIPIITQGT